MCVLIHVTVWLSVEDIYLSLDGHLHNNSLFTGTGTKTS